MTERRGQKKRVLNWSFFIGSFLVAAFEVSSSSNLERFLDETTTKTFETNCDSIVDSVRDESRFRFSVNQYSVEQIYERETIEIDMSSVKCSGIGLLSDGSRIAILYGAKVDGQGTWILSYELGDL